MHPPLVLQWGFQLGDTAGAEEVKKKKGKGLVLPRLLRNPLAEKLLN